MEILSIKNLSFTYSDRTEKAIDDLSLSVQKGDFTIICGRSGCGKTTLLRLIKKELAPNGSLTGDIFYKGKRLSDMSDRDSAQKIGFVLQDPEKQIVTDRVWYELAFGLESLGVKSDKIRTKVAEIAQFFGIDRLMDRSVDSLSGGEKQLVCIASVMVMSPEILLLDEPISRLDPIAASNLVSILTRINRELGTTVIVAEHKLDELFSFADSAAVLDGGRLLSFGAPRDVCAHLAKCDSDFFIAVPSAARIAACLCERPISALPMTIREGQVFMADYPHASLSNTVAQNVSNDIAISAKHVYFRYEKEGRDVLRDLSFDVRVGEICSIVGGNGTGKSTLLKNLSGIERSLRGKIEIFGKDIKKYPKSALCHHNIAYLPQSISAVFTSETVREELFDICAAMCYSKDDTAHEVESIAKKLSIDKLLDVHPYDLSGGEMHKAALAKILLTRPRILLLDEPTSGIDAITKSVLGKILKDIRSEGVTVVIVTHDLEFAAETSDRCGLFFGGNIVSFDEPHTFFSQNAFYTTEASRISRSVFDGAVTVGDVVSLGRSVKRGVDN